MERFKLSLEGREKISYFVVLILLLVLTAGLVKLQIIEHAELAEKSKYNRIRKKPIIPRWGVVRDREERIIIDNRSSYTISVIPAEEIKGKTLPNLSKLLNLDTIQIRKRIKKNMVSRYQPIPVKRHIPFEHVAVFEEQKNKFPGVTYLIEQVRQYDSTLGAETFTGYVGEISEEELKKLKKIDPKTYHLGSIIGKKGLEKQYNFLLRGHEGDAYIEVSASGQILGEYKEKKPIPAIAGANLTLTIDKDLQKACTQVLDTFCCGAIVAIDPRNGELLAMASYPSYNPNIFSTVIPESIWQAISSDTTHPLLNRPLNGLYPPGSTVKFVAIGAGLEEGLITANSSFKPCLGGMQFGNRFFRCWQVAGHGTLNAMHALEQSCDVYLYQLGLKLGVNKMSEYYGLCGFGKPTGIDLPAEALGENPNSVYYDKQYGVNKWTKTQVLNNVIGQGELLVTPLQLTQFFCGLANNGIVFQPHIVKKIIYPNGNKRTVLPKISFRLPFSMKTMRILKEGLRLVVEGEHGTAKSLKNEMYSIGGKTGSAENPHGDSHSWFVGVAPLDNPEIVVCVIVENAGHGSEVAAPLVGQIIKVYMEKKFARENITMTSKMETE